MKFILLATLAIMPMISIAQKVSLSVDKITSDTTYDTDMGYIIKEKRGFVTQRELSFSLSKYNEDDFTVRFCGVVPDRSVFLMTKNKDRVQLKLDDGSVVEGIAGDTDFSSVSSGATIYCMFYQIRPDDLVTLTKCKVVYIRLTHSRGWEEFDIPAKTQGVISSYAKAIIAAK